MSDTNYLGVPEGTLNKVVNYLLDQPYREVSELLKLLEAEIVTIQGAKKPEEVTGDDESKQSTR